MAVWLCVAVTAMQDEVCIVRDKQYDARYQANT